MGGSLNWLWNASVAYWYFGDMEDLPLRNAFSYGLGIGHSFFNQKLKFLYSIFGMSEIIEQTAPPILTAVGVSYKVGDYASLISNAGFGLSESSADYTVSLGWMIHMN